MSKFCSEDMMENERDAIFNKKISAASKMGFVSGVLLGLSFQENLTEKQKNAIMTAQENMKEIETFFEIQ